METKGLRADTIRCRKSYMSPECCSSQRRPFGADSAAFERLFDSVKFEIGCGVFRRRAASRQQERFNAEARRRRGASASRGVCLTFEVCPRAFARKKTCTTGRTISETSSLPLRLRVSALNLFWRRLLVPERTYTDEIRPARPCFSTRAFDPKCGEVLRHRPRMHAARGSKSCIALFAALLAGPACTGGETATPQFASFPSAQARRRRRSSGLSSSGSTYWQSLVVWMVPSAV